MKVYVFPGLALDWYMEVCTFEVYGGDPLLCLDRGPYVSGVSILKFSVFRNWFRVLRSSLHRLLGLGTRKSQL